MSNSQQRINDHSPESSNAPGSKESHPNQVIAEPNGLPEDATSTANDLIQRKSLTIVELAALCASNNSTSVFQQNATRTLRTELNADTVLIIDYTDAFGGKSVRAISGGDAAVVDSEIWLPEWLSPVDINSPITLIDTDPVQFTAISAVDAETEYRSALAIAIPGITGAAGMIIALAKKPVDLDDSQIESAKITASLLSLSASRSNALIFVQRGESQLAASRHITRSIGLDLESNGTGETKSLLHKISDQLRQFFEFDVIALRVQTESGGFTTLESRSIDDNHGISIPDSSPNSSSGTGTDAA